MDAIFSADFFKALLGDFAAFFVSFFKEIIYIPPGTFAANAGFLKAAAFFGLGVLAQTALLLRGAWRPKPVLAMVLCGFVVALPGKYNASYPLAVHALLGLVFFVALFAWWFRAELLPRMNELTLLSCVLTLWFAFFSFAYRPEALWNGLALALLLPSGATLYLVFNPGALKRGWKLFFFSWYLVILLLLLAWQFSFGHLLAFFTAEAVSLAPGEAALFGMAFCMGVVYAVYLFLLSPLWVPPMRGSRGHMHYTVVREEFIDLALSGYDAEGRLSRVGSALFLALGAAFFAAVSHYRFMTPETAVNLGILLPLGFSSPLPAAQAAAEEAERQ